MKINELLLDTSIQESCVIVKYQDCTESEMIIGSDSDGYFIIDDNNCRITVIDDTDHLPKPVSSISINIVVDMTKKSQIFNTDNG